MWKTWILVSYEVMIGIRSRKIVAEFCKLYALFEEIWLKEIFGFLDFGRFDIYETFVFSLKLVRARYFLIILNWRRNSTLKK